MGVSLQVCLLSALALFAIKLPAQIATQAAPESVPPLTLSTRLVVVPVLVRAPGGDLVHGLSASDFQLLDNGVPQKISLDPSPAQPQPLSILVLMQTGGTAARQFGYYSKLPTMLEYIPGGSLYRISVVTFDSQPEDQWDFSSNIDGLKDAFEHPQAGDGGAAIFDALQFGVAQLAHQPLNSRRILILLSQTRDEGSRVHPEEIIRKLGENNITIFSLSFSPEKTWLKDQFTKPRSEQPPYQMAPNHPPILHTFDILTPLHEAISAMRTNAASEVTSLAGGESLPFDDQRSLDSQLAHVANYIPNRYVLTFRPAPDHDGFHVLQVRVRNHPEFVVNARTSYWSAKSQGR